MFNTTVQHLLGLASFTPGMLCVAVLAYGSVAGPASLDGAEPEARALAVRTERNPSADEGVCSAP